MKKKVVLSTMFEDEFEEMMDKLEEMEVSIEEYRYDLLYHRYDIYVQVNLRQMHELRKFIKSHAVLIV